VPRWRGAAGLGVTGALVVGALLAPAGANAADDPLARAITFDTGQTLVENGWNLPSPTNNDYEILDANSFRLSNWLGNDGYGVQHQVLAPTTASAGETLSSDRRSYSYAFVIDGAFVSDGVRIAQPLLAVEAAVSEDGNRAGGNLIFRIPQDGKLELTNYSDPSAEGTDADAEWIGTSATVDLDEPLVVVYSVQFNPEADDQVDVSVYGTTSTGAADYNDPRASFEGGTFEYYHEGIGSDPQTANGLAFRAVNRAPNLVGDEILGWVTQTPDAGQKAFLQGKGFVFSDIAYGVQATAGVSGKPYYGQTLVAFTNADPGEVTVRYQWYRGSTAIKNATKSTYKAGSSDIGKTLKVRIRTYPSGSSHYTHSMTSAATAAIGGGQIIASGSPEIQGDALVGVKLSVVKPTYSVTGLSYSYRWYRDGVSISGATKSTYTLGAADRTKDITVKVTAKKSHYTTLAQTSEAVGPVDWGTLSVSQAPTISGTVKSGKTLTAKSNGWSTSGSTKLYFWYAWDGEGSPGDEDLVQVGTSSKLKLSSLHKGLKITVQVQGFKNGYGPGLVTSGFAGATSTVG
jgi:hypothetical protein